MSQVITPDEKARARHHLGYLGVQAASTFSLGVPAGVQTQFMVEGAWDRLLPESYGRFRDLLCKLDATENAIFCGLDMVDVNRINEIEINRARLREYATTYKIAQQALANLMGVPTNPWDQREWLQGGRINVSVM